MLKLALTALAVLAAAAALAPAANAQNVTVTDEATGNPCPAVSPNDSSEFPLDSAVTGGCTAHVLSTEGMVVMTAHIFGIESTDSQCGTEYAMRIGGNGEGYFTDVELSGQNCNRRPCGTAAGTPESWEIHIEETTSTTARLERHFCIENIGGGGRQTCHYFVPLREEAPGQHQYELGTVNASETRTEVGCEGFTGFRAELSGHWKTELTTLELVHTLQPSKGPLARAPSAL